MRALAVCLLLLVPAAGASGQAYWEEMLAHAQPVAAPVIRAATPAQQPAAAAVEVRWSPGGGCADLLVRAIDGAHRMVDAAIYSVNHPAITSALITAHRRGVKVRVIADRSESGVKTSGTKALGLAHVPLQIRRGSGGGIMHVKLLVVDGATAFAGSYNWTTRAETANDEVLLTVREPAAVRALASGFERLWGRPFDATHRSPATAGP